MMKKGFLNYCRMVGFFPVRLSNWLIFPTRREYVPVGSKKTSLFFTVGKISQLLSLTGKSVKSIALLFFLSSLLTACAPPPPQQPENICAVFTEYPNWYWAANETKKKWGVPVSVQMAIMFQESSFNAHAKPPRGKLLWVIPWKRPSTADGYSQALNQTWANYKRQTGNTDASRHDFRDASDFIGWYAYHAHQKAGISEYSAYALYLAYHEGVSGYQEGTYKCKPWLMNVAQKVQSRANRYQRQLSVCEGRLKKPWWKLF